MSLLRLLTLPVLGVPEMVYWLAQKMAEQAESELLDEARVRGELMELQTRYDLGEVGDEEYRHRELILIERLNIIREIKAERRNRGE